MPIIQTGVSIRIFNEGIQVLEKIPNKVYRLNFTENQGFSLEEVENTQEAETKVYGSHKERINRVLRTFSFTDRSLGILCSGAKGIGKSLFTRLLGKELRDRDIPTIIVDTAYPGTALYLASISQSCYIILDEFEKMYQYDSVDTDSAQNEFLSVLDGTSLCKHIFALTINHIVDMSPYFLNRPGRIHFHFRFDKPETGEIENYLMDNLHTEVHGEIPRILSYSKLVAINYDILRAIVFELNIGSTFDECLADLNILTDSTGDNASIELLIETDKGNYSGTWRPEMLQSINELGRLHWDTEDTTVYGVYIDLNQIRFDSKIHIPNSAIITKNSLSFKGEVTKVTGRYVETVPRNRLNI